MLGAARLRNGVRSPSPILLGLALHHRRDWVLELQPVSRTAATIRRAEPLGHDALAAELAGMAEDGRAIVVLRLAAEAAFDLGSPRAN
jgi:hypothetical protein